VSHTTEAEGGTVFIHNGDYSGDIRVISRKGEQLDDGRFEVEVPFTDLRAIVLGYLRDRMISDLENASGDTLEAMLTRGSGVAW
jgi:hypothetical protein